MMTQNEWQRLLELFSAATALPPEARDAFLERACAGDVGLKQRLVALLGADAEAGGFMEEPLVRRLHDASGGGRKDDPEAS